MTFTTDGTCMVKMEHSGEEISAVLAESRQERKRLRKLGKVMETVYANTFGWPRSSGHTREGLDGAGGLSLVM